MRTLNTKFDDRKDFGAFSLPGFRSGSNVKKIIACIYYTFSIIFVAVFTILIIQKASFDGIRDIFVFIMFDLFITSLFVAPVIAVGFSNHYDWHGIKLILIIMVLWCVLYTAAGWSETLFSEKFRNSYSGAPEKIKVDTSQKSDAEGNLTPDVDNEVINDNLKDIISNSASQK